MTAQAHIEALERKHAALEAEIASLLGRPRPDDAAIAELKKRKLVLKEEIRRAATH